MPRGPKLAFEIRDQALDPLKFTILIGFMRIGFMQDFAFNLYKFSCVIDTNKRKIKVIKV
jgi:hypothetical protein